jgi:hypothetical protein
MGTRPFPAQCVCIFVVQVPEMPPSPHLYHDNSWTHNPQILPPTWVLVYTSVGQLLSFDLVTKPVIIKLLASSLIFW